MLHCGTWAYLVTQQSSCSRLGLNLESDGSSLAVNGNDGAPSRVQTLYHFSCQNVLNESDETFYE